MQAIILAAGMGRRLGEYTKENTKCMVPVNGIPLIDRMLNQLGSLGLDRITIVVGYEGAKLQAYIGDRFADKIRIEYIENPIYDRTNNIYSLALAKDRLMEDDTLLIESDLILDDSLFTLLLDNPHPNLALVAKYESWMEGTVVRIDENRNIVNFITQSAFDYSETDCYYKTINIYKFSKKFSSMRYVPFLEAYCKAVGNNEYYENVLRIISFLDSSELKALPITNEKWYEIDDKQDLDIAEALFADEKDILRKYYGRFGGFWRFPDMLDFCYLVNPYFPARGMAEELKSNFETILTSYPSGMKVNTLLASKCWGVNESYIIPGNGAAELIKILMEQLPAKTGIIRPTFEEYPSRLNDRDVVTFIPQDKDFRYTANDIMEHFGGGTGIKSLILVNPDNPSGNFIPKADILYLASWCRGKGIMLVVDESFVDFSDEWETSSLLHDDILEANPNLIVIKSISSSSGVPGLRLGIMASSDRKLIDSIRKELPIWNINSFAEYFMQVYSKYENDYAKACERFITERKRFEHELREIPFLRVMPTQANYFLCEILPPFSANEVVLTMLKRHNILTRDCSSKIGLDGKQYMRIAIRNTQENNRLTETLKTLKK
ncbi:MAG: aminotransferase class I/II-fold pyridoxal phosphate-dependent enzyme [Clostridium sp.]|nr:aminotransferase class I/II-fold pyridoxal phosphate-dependent enzyme [Bacteroides sp.]MCM1197286.1 aminotransferase class I/II-fold pyridoxal phosphate-dependent enzyme [Clostridium sp.]